MKIHKTKDVKIIPLNELELDHLKNIIKFIERKAEKGFIIAVGGCYYDIESIWYDEIFYQGNEALEYLNYKDYVDELEKRINNK